MLNRQELKKLRKQICLGSLYYSDYQNNMGIDKTVCCVFFDGYLEYLKELLYEEHPDVSNREYYDLLWSYDTIDNLENWYWGFEVEPLPITEKFEYELAA